MDYDDKNSILYFHYPKETETILKEYLEQHIRNIIIVLDIQNKIPQEFIKTNRLDLIDKCNVVDKLFMQDETKIVYCEIFENVFVPRKNLRKAMSSEQKILGLQKIEDNKYKFIRCGFENRKQRNPSWAVNKTRKRHFIQK